MFSVQKFDGSQRRCLNTRPQAACSNPFRVIQRMFEHKKQIMVERYSCIFTLIHLTSLENNINNVKLIEYHGASSMSAILFLRNT